ncbi:MAG: DUF4114 domain-containing protein [Phycisphaerales bacterium]|nr:MAG: DUF4114 domain-containing protein [Phycisphaerales bacterium]
MNITRTLLSIGVVGLLAVSANADFTQVTDSGSEATVREIFDHYFGVATSGPMTGTLDAAHEWYTFDTGGGATRVNDFGAGYSSPIDLLTPNLSTDNDMIWTDGIATFEVQARFAGYDQSFGIDTDLTNSVVDHNEVFSVTGSGYTDTGLSGGASGLHLSGEWAWTRAGSDAGPWSSNAPDNTDSLDHVVTYLLDPADGKTNETVWWVFFEDLNNLGDHDYNDLAVEIRAQPIPVPGAAILGLVGLGMVGAVRGRFS